jgi:transposase
MCKAVGLDISLQKIAVCVLDLHGQLVWQGKVDSEPGPLIEKLRPWRDEIDVVGLEACPLSEWLHRHLVAAGFKAVCVETRHAQRFLSTRPVKTDRNDARGIAEMMRIGHYRPVHVKSAKAQVVRTVLQARRQVVATLLQIQGSIRGLLRMHGLKMRRDAQASVRQARARIAGANAFPEYRHRAVAAGAGTVGDRTGSDGQASGTSRQERSGLPSVDDHPRRWTDHQPRLQDDR